MKQEIKDRMHRGMLAKNQLTFRAGNTGPIFLKLPDTEGISKCQRSRP